MDRLTGLNGVFAVLKPTGESSAKTVDRVKTALIRSALSKAAASTHPGALKKLSRQIKVGHGGTLDPMATGILVIGLNGGCKELSRYLSGPKSYMAEARFGEHFDTLDCTGKLLQRDATWRDKCDRVEAVLGKFVGEAVMQVPPAFSAIHVNGQRAYDLARKDSAAGNTETDEAPLSLAGPPVVAQREASFDIPARPVSIESVTYTPLTLPLFPQSVRCGGGCYIRSLIRDIAAELGTLAVMTKLERCKQGIFELDMCLGSEEEWGKLESVEEAIKRSKALL